MIAFAGALGVIMSLPGQTIGVSAFTDPLMEAVGLSRSQLSLAYLIGTSASALILTPAGKMYDRFGSRVMAIVSAVIMGIILILLSYSGAIAEHYASNCNIIIALMAFSFFVLRFSGQGVLTMSCRNMSMKWFDHYRGLVNGLQGPIVALGFSMAPAWFGSMIALWEWDNTWRYIGFFALTVFVVFAWVFYRDNPEDCGLKPDGETKLSHADGKSFPVVQEMTLREARKTVSFWAIALTLSYSGLFITAFSYHHRAIFSASGVDVDNAIKFFFPAAAVLSVALKIIGGIMSDHVSVRTLLYIFASGHLLSAIGLFLLDTTTGLWITMLGYGINGGFFTILAGVCYPRLFGRRHLGAISGLSMSMIVFASAFGPYLFSRVNDLTGSFMSNFYLLIILIGFLIGFAARTTNPQLKLTGD
jgi:MFS transporter, OFA family, oxalate/formate antiporter